MLLGRYIVQLTLMEIAPEAELPGVYRGRKSPTRQYTTLFLCQVFFLRDGP